MTLLTIEKVKQKFDLWRQTARSRQKLPKNLIDDVKELSKKHSISDLFKEFKIFGSSGSGKEILKFQRKYVNSLELNTLLSSRFSYKYPKKFIKEMLLQLKQGIKPSELSKKYNIPDSTISNWIHRPKTKKYINQHSDLMDNSIPESKDNSSFLVPESITHYINSPDFSPKDLTIKDFKEYLQKFKNVKYKDGVFHIIDKNMEPEFKTIKKKIKEECPITKIDKDLQKMDNYIFITKFLSSLIISFLFYKLSYFEILSIFSISYGFFNIMVYLLHFFYKNNRKDLSL